MDIEQKQEELIDHFVKQASSLSGSALASVVAEATSHPSLFAFSEILAVPNVLQLEGTENSVYLDVLRVFAHGTWSDYKSKYAKHASFCGSMLYYCNVLPRPDVAMSRLFMHDSVLEAPTDQCKIPLKFQGSTLSFASGVQL